ncbi:MAG: penicillin acylase family protein [Saprospiraceae bacterium]|nr:penicillin acylase family protein [Saprospiraceae bacterium]
MGFLSNILKPFIKSYIKNASKKTLADYNLKLNHESLHEPVEVLRDKWAVPHIYANNRFDLFFAQGFCHAQDRFWQMEVMRRVASGRLSELFGKEALDTDRTARTLGFARCAKGDFEMLEKKHKKDFMDVLEAYTAGVNAFITKEKYPTVEHKLLKTTPEKWLPTDTLGIARLLSFQLAYGWQSQLVGMELVAAVGADKALEIFPEYRADNPIALPNGIENFRLEDGRLKAFKGPFLHMQGASNNWTVAAHKMESDSAVLCNDPHLILSAPGIWYENHLIAPDCEVTGASIPGAPMVLIGHNRKIAWGATLSLADSQDIFIERFTSPQALQYHYGDRILKAVNIRESIKIKKQKNDHVETIIKTHHGPIISDILGMPEHKIALASSALKEDNEMIIGFFELNIAENWDDFVHACSKIHAPSLNLAYADTDDNIGYYMTGKIPVREKAHSFLPQDGSDPTKDWKGFVPFEEMPHSLNPKRGYVYTCNHKIIPDDFPHNLGQLWMNGYRANRLQQLLDSKDKYTMEDFANWQMDFHSIPGLQLRAIYQKDLIIRKRPQDYVTVLETFRNWDGVMDKDSVGACIYQVLKQQLVDLLVASALGEDLSKKIRGLGYDPVLLKQQEFLGHDMTMVLRILDNPDSLWLKEISKEELLDKALVQTIAYLKKHLGSNIQAWKWGELHQLTYSHILSQQKPLDEVFNVGSFPISGDTDTLCQTAFLGGEHFGDTIVAASYRQIINMGNLGASKCVSPLGQSGNPASPHYQDQVQTWLKGELRPMLWHKNQVEEYTQYRMQFEPK